MQPRNHASRLKGIPKTKLQGSGASTPKTLQLKTHPFAEKRLSINGLTVVHGRRLKCLSGAARGTRTPDLKGAALHFGSVSTLAMLVFNRSALVSAVDLKSAPSAALYNWASST